jgi:hypothetical protein
MNLECKNAQVTMYWDGSKMMELIIKNQSGDILLVQIQGNGAVATNIHNEGKWGDENAGEV